MSCNFSTTCSTATVGSAGTIFSSALNFFAAAQCLITENWPASAKVASSDEFDFIIVGSGTAGSALASRLSEITEWSVLLLEAGGDPPVESIIPNLDSSMFRTKYDWQYTTVNDGRTNDANINRTVYWPRGKMVGGCSSINAMIYFRGCSGDYDNWCNIAENDEWCYDQIEPYFKKLENLQDYSLRENSELSEFYGTDGPLQISTFNSTYRALTEEILSAWNENNVSTVDDLNYANMMGSAIFRVNAVNGSRFSAGKAYLNPYQSRPNLKIVKNALVTKVLIDDSLTAYGVEVLIDGVTITFNASKEVILSAGAVNSPQLLMLSGIGPQAHLESLNITCLLNLPAVGQNLQDHLIIPTTIYGNNSVEEVVANNLDSLLYLFNRTGSLAQNSFADISAFYTTEDDNTCPLHQSMLLVFPKNSSRVRTIFGGRYKSYLAESVINQNVNQSLYYFSYILLHPCSTGNISLNTSNPKDKPLIYANYFGCEEDLNTAAAGLKVIASLVNTTYFKSIGGNLGRMNWTACDGYQLNTDEYWKCIAKNIVITIYHPVGTTRMGNCSDTSVVDSHLRVHGVNNLRVIDAGMMPSHISGNNNGAVYMIAERASDLIKEDYSVMTSSS